MDTKIWKTVEDYEKAITILESEVLLNGRPITACTEETGCSESQLQVVKRVYQLARRGEADAVLDLYSRRLAPLALIEAVYKRVGEPVPAEVYELRESRRIEGLKKQWVLLGLGTAATNNERELGTGTNATPLWAQSMLLNQAKIISLLEDMIDACVPKYAGDIVESNAKIDTHLVQLINKLS